MADKGNPNFFTTYKERFALTPSVGATSTNTTLMYSIVNEVQFAGNVELTDYLAGSTFATLPAACRSDSPMKIPVIVSVPGVTVEEPAMASVVALSIDPNGSLSLGDDYPTATVYLEGTSFNVVGNIYKEVVQV